MALETPRALQELAARIMGNGTKVMELKQGVSGTKVVVVQNDSESCVLKLGRTNLRNTIKDEIERGHLLTPYMGEHIPTVLEHGVVKAFADYGDIDYMRMPLVGDQNLHEVVIRGSLPDTETKNLYRQITGKKLDMWLATQQPFSLSDCLRDYPGRNAELKARILALPLMDGATTIQQVASLALVINGKTYPSFSDVLKNLCQYHKPTSSVISHGDLNADNIIIQLKDKHWFLIDWEWAGRHDWRESAARMLGWWLTNASRLQQPPQIRHSSDALTIDYQLEVSQLVRSLIQQTLKIAGEMGDKTKDTHWESMFRKFVAVYCLRDLQFQGIRSRNEYFLPILCEAVRTLYSPLTELVP